MLALATQERPTPPCKVADPPRPRPRRRWLRILVVMILGAFSAVALEAAWVLAGPNYHVVLPGQLYRSGQLDTLSTLAVVRSDGIRTVINLRGCCEDADWYHEESRLLAELGVKQLDIMLSSYSLPSVQELQKLVRALDECEYPVLMHCRRGSDRTGLASAIGLLMRSDADIAAARRHLSWRYGHFGLIQVASLESVIDMYEEWLIGQGKTHRPGLLRQWAFESYRPAQCWAEIEALEVPAQLICGRRAPAQFRVTNRSAHPWRFAKEPNAGVHLSYVLAQPDALKHYEGDVGFFPATLLPGESIEFTVPLPAIREPGRYRFLVDMYDCRMAWFHRYGSPRFEGALEVVDE
jgi:protein tyrosine phosphatase (PTP) superfamily phosphohydrolase (DUF442 family)